MGSPTTIVARDLVDVSCSPIATAAAGAIFDEAIGLAGLGPCDDTIEMLADYGSDLGKQDAARATKLMARKTARFF